MGALGRVYVYLGDKGIPADLGLVRSVRVKEGMTRFVLLLPSGWCPIAANLLAQVEDQIAEQPGRHRRPRLARAMRGPGGHATAW